MLVTPKTKAGVWLSAKPFSGRYEDRLAQRSLPSPGAFCGVAEVIAKVPVEVKYKDNWMNTKFTYENLLVRTEDGVVGWVGAGATIEVKS